MANIYFYISTLAFVMLAIIWSSRTWLNISIKFVLICLAGSGVLLSLMSLGFVIRD